MKFEKFGIIVYILAFILGCGVSNYDRGVSFLGQEEFDTAIPYFEAAIDSGVNTADAHRELGITYYKQEMAQQAANHLRIATKNGRKDSRAAFFLAVALEENGDFDEALDAYRKFIKLNSSQSIGQDIRSRIVLVKGKKDNQFVQEAVTGELGANSGKTLDNRIVAHYLEITPGSADPVALQKSLTSLLISDLAKVDQVDVVRRSLLQKLINMIDLDQDAILNTKNIKRIGHLLRAKHVISGKIEESSDGAFRLNLFLNKIDSNEVQQISTPEEEKNDLFELQKTLVFSILESLNIQPVGILKKALLKKETESMSALILFGQGLDSVDRSDYATAVKLLRDALSEDPDFELAKKVLNEAEALEVARGQDLSLIETNVVRRIKSQSAIHDRFAHMDSALTREFAPPTAADATLEGDAPPPETPITIIVKQ